MTECRSENADIGTTSLMYLPTGGLNEYPPRWGPIMEVRHFGDRKHLMVFQRDGTFGRIVARTVRVIGEPTAYARWESVTRTSLRQFVVGTLGVKAGLDVLTRPGGIRAGSSQSIDSEALSSMLNVVKRSTRSDRAAGPGCGNGYELYTDPIQEHGFPFVTVSSVVAPHKWLLRTYRYSLFGILLGEDQYAMDADMIVLQWRTEPISTVQIERAPPSAKAALLDWQHRGWKIFVQTFRPSNGGKRSRFMAFDPMVRNEGPVAVAEDGSGIAATLTYDRYGNLLSEGSTDVPCMFQLPIPSW